MTNQHKFKHLFIIGDSFCDNGTLTSLSEDIFSKINQHFFGKYSLPPIKKIVIEKPYTPFSLSNGELFTSILAKKFKCDMKPAWEYHYDKINSSQIGNNYALIGARIKRANFKSGLGALIFDRFTIDHQINALIKQHKIYTDDYVLISIGANDLIFNHQKQDIVNKMILKIKSNLEKLIYAKANKIILFEMIDLGQIPRFKNDNTKSILLTSLSYGFNQEIKKLAAFFSHNYMNLQIYVYPLLEVIKKLSKKFMENYHLEPQISALKIDLIAMMDHGIIKSQTNGNSNYDKNINYFYVDDVHLSKWVHQELAKEVYYFLNNLF